jgi:hypothetical protein
MGGGYGARQTPNSTRLTTSRYPARQTWPCQGGMGRCPERDAVRYIFREIAALRSQGHDPCSSCGNPGLGIEGRSGQALDVGVPTSSFLATKPSWPPRAQRVRTTNHEEKRRFKGRVAAAALARRLLANYPPSGTTRDVVRGRKDQKTAHKRTPPAGITME